jgi:hypothetical protein
MLKNWLVKMKQIKKGSKGFINHSTYLSCNNRAAHEKTDITVLNDASKNIINEVDKRTLYRQKNSLTGGGVRNYASSFVISLPNNIKQPTTEEWEKISLYAIKKIAEATDINFNELRKISHIVLHNEDRSLNKNNHVHILVGNVLDNKVIKKVSQYGALHAIKESVNYSVKKLLNEDNNTYIPKNSNVKDKPLYVARAEKIEIILNNFSKFKNSLNNWIDTVIKKKNAFISSNQAAKDFNDFDNGIGDQLGDKILNQIEEIEEFEMPDTLKHTYKVTPKTNRKRRRRLKR